MPNLPDNLQHIISLDTESIITSYLYDEAGLQSTGILCTLVRRDRRENTRPSHQASHVREPPSIRAAWSQPHARLSL